MRQSVLDAYVPFTTKFEGKLGFPYLDVKGLVTTGIGNLIDPIETALSLPWVRKDDGSRATESEIRQAWNAVKARQDLKMKGGVIFGGLTNIRLNEEGIKEVVSRKLLQNEEILRKRFRSYDLWPADAQLGLLSMAWAAGAGFRSPKFEAAANSLMPDFKTMAIQSHFNDTANPGLRPRNEANVQLFNNAASIIQQGLDLEQLVYNDFTNKVGALALAGASAVRDAAGAVSIGANKALNTASQNKVSTGALIAGTCAFGYLGWQYLNSGKRAVA